MLACIYASSRCANFLLDENLSNLLDKVVTLEEVEFAINAVLFTCVSVVVVTSLQLRRGVGQLRKSQSSMSIAKKWEAYALVILSLWPRQSQDPPTTHTRTELPTRSVVDPTLMVWVMHRILRRRREQIQQREMPERLTDEAATQVYLLKSHCTDLLPVFALEPDSKTVDREVEKIFRCAQSEHNETAVRMWDAVVRMYGFPTVQNSEGKTAQFGKRRSVEVLAWLAMNSDRARRSAVRTAVWEIDISDSSFSTVMSDVRRGLNALSPGTPDMQWIPPTFTDEIHIGRTLTSDYHLLRSVYEDFLLDSTKACFVLNELSQIRDTPFAGANYLWADLDGTTTRMVVLALKASQSVAEWAMERNDTEAFFSAIRAGLRVLPGCEELVELEQSFILQSGLSPRKKIAG